MTDSKCAVDDNAACAVCDAVDDDSATLVDHCRIKSVVQSVLSFLILADVDEAAAFASKLMEEILAVHLEFHSHHLEHGFAAVDFAQLE